MSLGRSRSSPRKGVVGALMALLGKGTLLLIREHWASWIPTTCWADTLRPEAVGTHCARWRRGLALG